MPTQEVIEAGTTRSVLNGVRFSTQVTPAQYAACGGDWCETFMLSEGIVALSIGDVCGHGPAAFPAMLVARQAVRDAALLGLNPQHTLAVANRILCGRSQGHATALFAMLDTRRGRMTFANAGHPPPLLVGPFGTRFLTYGVADLPLGVEDDLLPCLHAAGLPARALLVLYTDGVTEHERRPLRGEAQLRDAARLAYTYSASPTASAIEALMFLTPANRDDASILTAWMPSAAPAMHRDRSTLQKELRLAVRPGAVVPARASLAIPV